MKLLPLGENEQEAIDAIIPPKIRSRQCPVEVMCLGVVACPNRAHNFDGRIFLKRASRQKKLTKKSRSKQFSIDAHGNEATQQGHWRELHAEHTAM